MLPKFRMVLGLAGAIIFLTAFAYGATVSGTVKGPDGAPFKGAFVEAQNEKTRITVNVLSDKDGRHVWAFKSPFQQMLYGLSRIPAAIFEVHGRIYIIGILNLNLERAYHTFLSVLTQLICPIEETRGHFHRGSTDYLWLCGCNASILCS